MDVMKRQERAAKLLRDEVILELYLGYRKSRGVDWAWDWLIAEIDRWEEFD